MVIPIRVYPKIVDHDAGRTYVGVGMTRTLFFLASPGYRARPYSSRLEPVPVVLTVVVVFVVPGVNVSVTSVVVVPPVGA